MNTQACYRKLKSYKYQLMEDFEYETGFEIVEAIDTEFIKMSQNGDMTVNKYYAWDGASGPTIDTPNSMRASLVHDALYQLMRMSKLPQKFVKPADKLFRKILIEDGMSEFRAGGWYNALRIFKGKHAKPSPEQEDEIICEGNPTNP